MNKQTLIALTSLFFLIPQARAQEPMKSTDDNQTKIISQDGEYIPYRRAASAQNGALILVNDKVFIGTQVIQEANSDCYKSTSKVNVKTLTDEHGLSIQLPEVSTVREKIVCPLVKK